MEPGPLEQCSYWVVVLFRNLCDRGESEYPYQVLVVDITLTPCKSLNSLPEFSLRTSSISMLGIIRLCADFHEPLYGCFGPAIALAHPCDYAASIFVDLAHHGDLLIALFNGIGTLIDTYRIDPQCLRRF